MFESRDARGGGFDIVLANPPYHQLQRDGGRLANLYRDAGYRTFVRSGDIYQLFYERGCELLKPEGGVLAYITSNSWLRAEYGKRLRGFFAERQTPLRWLDLGKDVFESAIVDSGVLLLRTGGEAAPFPAVDMDRLPDVGFPPPERLWGRVHPSADTPWSVLSIPEQSAMGKMRSRGTPLSVWDLQINRGVTTGYNAAFIVDDSTREALVADDPKSEELIKPLLRGRDIRRYKARWAGRWLIATFPILQCTIDDYPAIRGHLQSFGQNRLEQAGRRLPGGGRSRKRTGHRWFETQDATAYHEEFAKPKLMWIDLADEGRFAYDETGALVLDTGFILAGPSQTQLKYLCAVLNSRLVTWFMHHTGLTSGMGTTRWKRFAVERIPVPHPADGEQHQLVEMVDRILSAKDANEDADISEITDEIDRLVYGLYDLTMDEVVAIERGG